MSRYLAERPAIGASWLRCLGKIKEKEALWTPYLYGTVTAHALFFLSRPIERPRERSAASHQVHRGHGIILVPVVQE